MLTKDKAALDKNTKKSKSPLQNQVAHSGNKGPLQAQNKYTQQSNQLTNRVASRYQKGQKE